MTFEHVPAADVTPPRVSGPQVLNLHAVTRNDPAPIASPAADVPPDSNDAKQTNGHCSGYNVWA